MRRRRLAQLRARGQAVLEAALGLLLFTTVLMFGIHFGEVMFLSLEVQSAGAAAAFDTSGHKLHDYERGDNVVSLQDATLLAQHRAEFRHRDYDGAGSDRGPGTTQVFTRASPLRVECAPDRAIADWSDVESRAFPGNRPIFSAGRLRPNSGVACTASGTVSPLAFSRDWLDAEGGFFKARHYVGPAAIRLCALGTAKDGQCEARYAMLVDDWGLNGLGSESRACVLTDGASCDNPGYYRLVEPVYRSLMDESADGMSAVDLRAAAELASRVTQNGSPIEDPEEFWFSYSNKDTGWVDPTFPEIDEGKERWNSGTGKGSRQINYKDAYENRADAWLGMPKNWSPR